MAQKKERETVFYDGNLCLSITVEVLLISNPGGQKNYLVTSQIVKRVQDHLY